MARELLPEYKKLILKLNELVPDIATMELSNNNEASIRVVRGLLEFENNNLKPFKEKIKEIRKEIVLSTRQRKTNKQK